MEQILLLTNRNPRFDWLLKTRYNTQREFAWPPSPHIDWRRAWQPLFRTVSMALSFMKAGHRHAKQEVAFPHQLSTVRPNRPLPTRASVLALQFPSHASL